MSTGNIKVNIADGGRSWLPNPHNLLLQLWRNGTDLAHERFYDANSITLTFEVHDNFKDQFRVVAVIDDHVQAGFHPVDLVAGETVPVFLMLIGKKARLNFREAHADQLPQNAPRFADLLQRSGGDARFAALLDSPAPCAAMLNITTAMNDIPLQKHALEYFTEIIWDNLPGAPRPTQPQPDRFFAFTESGLKDDIIALGKEFTEEKNPAKKGHPGATSSYKQNLLGEANVQITFHENDTDSAGNVKTEVDIDFFSDPLSHFFLEVVPNTLTSGKTDPGTVYVLRWMAARQKGLSFNPPYRIA